MYVMSLWLDHSWHSTIGYLPGLLATQLITTHHRAHVLSRCAIFHLWYSGFWPWPWSRSEIIRNMLGSVMGPLRHFCCVSWSPCSCGPSLGSSPWLCAFASHPSPPWTLFVAPSPSPSFYLLLLMGSWWLHPWPLASCPLRSLATQQPALEAALLPPSGCLGVGAAALGRRKSAPAEVLVSSGVFADVTLGVVSSQARFSEVLGIWCPDAGVCGGMGFSFTGGEHGCGGGGPPSMFTPGRPGGWGWSGGWGLIFGWTVPGCSRGLSSMVYSPSILVFSCSSTQVIQACSSYQDAHSSWVQVCCCFPSGRSGCKGSSSTDSISSSSFFTALGGVGGTCIAAAVIGRSGTGTGMSTWLYCVGPIDDSTKAGGW